MTARQSIGLAIAAAGAALAAIGLLVASGALSWFGRLPGDIRVERPGFRVYVPVTSMILASIALSLLAALVRRLWR